ncbi:hypothetical protein C8J57DRAFT_1728606 [Mycena rebaudengoi]|nr:hypothetical protein C8J57DRAFT_1728606 [Mycena rebaudengoi]
MLWAFWWSLLFLLPPFVLSAPSTCGFLSAAQIQSVPGWPALQTAVEGAYGNSPYKIATNDREFPQRPASLCAGVASGWVWFNYHTKVQDHYKWSFEIEVLLPHIPDRTVPEPPRPTMKAKLRRAPELSDL